MSGRRNESARASGLLLSPVRWPIPVLLLTFAITAALAMVARSFAIDASAASLLPENDPERALTREVERDFGDDDGIVVGIFSDDVFAPDTLARIDELSSRLWQLDGVASVTGPTSFMHVEQKGKRLRLAPLVRHLPKTEKEAEALREALVENPLARGRIVSADGRAAAIRLRSTAASDETGLRLALADQVRRLAEQWSGPETVVAGGPEILTLHARRWMERDLVATTAAAMVVVLVVALVALRSLIGAVLCLLVAGSSVVWMVAAMVVSGHAITWCTLVLPPLVAVLAVAHPLQIVNRYRIESGAVAAKAVCGVRFTLAISVLSALVGAASLGFSAIPGLRDFALFASVGIASSLIVAMAVVPAGLVLLPISAAGRRSDGSPGSGLRWLERVGGLLLRHRGAMGTSGLLLVLAAATGIPRLAVESGYLGFFDEGDRARAAGARVADSLGGARTLSILIDGAEPGAVGELGTLRAMRDLQRFIDRQPGVEATESLLDYLAQVPGAPRSGTGIALPETQAETDQLLRFDWDQLWPVVNRDLSRTRIAVHVSPSRAGDIGDLADRILAFASPKLLHIGLGRRAQFPRGVTVRPAGEAFLFSRAGSRLAGAQGKRFAAVAGVLLIVSSLVFLSLRVGLVSVLLNAAAVAVILGCMGWSGSPLSILGVLLPPLVLGVAVGQTIHYLTVLSAQPALSGAKADPVAGAVGAVGRPIAYSAVALVAGFLIFGISPFPPVRGFGHLGAELVTAAFAGNVLLLATRALTARVITISDVLVMKLDPLHQIPLFEGLHPFQAKIVVLTGHLASATRGDFITRRGDTSAELYLLLSGRAVVSPGDGRPAVDTLERGDVIGEMGLVRAQPRSADVIATEDTEYLVLDGGFLERLRRQYPRTAATVFLNLTRILSNRLEHTTRQLAELSRKQAVPSA
jgi:predicted RND superfamily exporter protein